MKTGLHCFPPHSYREGVRAKVLICPLNWGLGHATRCVPIIKKLMAEGHELVIVADGFPLQFLKQEFDSLRFLSLPSYRIKYQRGYSQVAAMICSFPALFFGIIREHRWLNNLLKSEQFDWVISDNRFGMWNKNVHSIYITHQLMIKMPKWFEMLEPIARRFHGAFINRYDECWIPDFEGDTNLSGDLAHKYKLPENAKFIGILSRFHGFENIDPNTDYDVVAVISGLEPHRTMFENKILDKYRNQNYRTLIIAGQPKENTEEINIGNVTRVSHLSTPELASVLLGSSHIICRSGYSSIMDLKILNCLHKAELIPTPGQTEQEYLAIIHNPKHSS